MEYKNWFQRLLCKHNFEQIESFRTYEDVVCQKANLPNSVYLRWVCKKCGKIKRRKLF